MSKCIVDSREVHCRPAGVGAVVDGDAVLAGLRAGPAGKKAENICDSSGISAGTPSASAWAAGSPSPTNPPRRSATENTSPSRPCTSASASLGRVSNIADSAAARFDGTSLARTSIASKDCKSGSSVRERTRGLRIGDESSDPYGVEYSSHSRAMHEPCTVELVASSSVRIASSTVSAADPTGRLKVEHDQSEMTWQQVDASAVAPKALVQACCRIGRSSARGFEVEVTRRRLRLPASSRTSARELLSAVSAENRSSSSRREVMVYSVAEYLLRELCLDIDTGHNGFLRAGAYLVVLASNGKIPFVPVDTPFVALPFSVDRRPRPRCHHGGIFAHSLGATCRHESTLGFCRVTSRLSAKLRHPCYAVVVRCRRHDRPHRRAHGKLALADSQTNRRSVHRAVRRRLLVVLVPLFVVLVVGRRVAPVRERLRANPFGVVAAASVTLLCVLVAGAGAVAVIAQSVNTWRSLDPGTADAVPAARGEGSDGCRAHRKRRARAPNPVAALLADLGDDFVFEADEPFT